MNRLFISILLLVTLSLLFGCKKESEAQPEKPEYEFRYDADLDIIGKDGAIKGSFKVEVVEREDEVMQGLKYRESMAANQGMLFIFAIPDYYDFWMQDTYLPLDIIYMDSAKSIFQINENAKPFSEERITPTQVNSFVLELNAGTAKQLNIQTGDTISWRLK